MARLARIVLVMVALALPIGAGAALVAVVVDGTTPGLLDADGPPLVTRLQALAEVTVDRLGEDPRIAPEDPGGDLPLCETVHPRYEPSFRAAFALMRGTDEGRRLYALVVAREVCVRVDRLPYNAAYARLQGSDLFGWSESEIVVDRRYLRSTDTDILAAILVHEATHVDRAISGKACWLADDCTELPNGVHLEEEVEAHAAEARWWIAAYGDDGKRFAIRDDYAENQLVEAYQRGGVAFRAYVRRIRSDAREGEGF